MTEAMPSDRVAAAILSEYHDGWGQLRRTPPEVVARLVAALTPWTESAAPEAPAKPDHCFAPDWMERGERIWGVGVQLYGLRSIHNWGIGDFTDLARVAQLLAEQGADFVAVNPLHALFTDDPGRFSPYSPSSREFINVLYIDVTAMESYRASPAAREAVESLSFQSLLVELRQHETVDYVAVAAAKDRICRLVFADFETRRQQSRGDPLVRRFDAFIAERGAALRHFSLYQALSREPGFGNDWTRWPAAFHDPSAAAVAEYAAQHSEEVRYHAFLQWEADLQLAACAAAARRAGMRIGLYLDLALGTAPESADGWSARDSMIRGFHIGAPPDPWNENGQDWGLFAYHPRIVTSAIDSAFRRVLDANLRHAGALRLDHVLGLNRLFLVPAGGRPVDGAYLHYPVARFCAVIAAASAEKHALIIGEDLGTVPEGLRELLASYGLLTYRLLLFARDEQGRFLSPDAYPRNALVAIATHDLPTFAGFWTMRDITMRSALHLYSEPGLVQAAREERRRTKEAMTMAVAAAGLMIGEDLSAVAIAMHRFLARTPSAFFVVQMEDVNFETDQVNVPGTVDAYPNWQRKLSRDIEEIFRDPKSLALFAAIRAERARGSTTP